MWKKHSHLVSSLWSPREHVLFLIFNLKQNISKREFGLLHLVQLLLLEVPPGGFAFVFKCSAQAKHASPG